VTVDPDRSSWPAVPFVEVLAANSRRDRRATIPVTAFVSAEIFDDEPWHPHGTQTPSRERCKFVRRDAVPHNARSGVSLALSHQRMAVKRRGQAKPVKAASRRCARREP